MTKRTKSIPPWEDPDSEYMPVPSDAVQVPVEGTDDLFTAGRESPGPLDDYLTDKARTDLGYEPAPPPKPVSAPAQVLAKQMPPKEGPEPIGAKPMPFWLAGLRQVPGMISSAYGAGHAKNPYSKIPEMIQANNERNQSLGDAQIQSQMDYQDKAAALARKRRAQAKIDSRQGVIDQRAETTFAQSQEDRARAKDPDSDVNQRFREAAEATFPGIREKVPHFDTLTMEDAGSVRQYMDSEQGVKEAKAKQAEHDRTRGEKMEDWKERENLREKNRLERQRRWLGGKGDFAQQKTAAMTALVEQYGGEDKVPPLARERVKNARNPKELDTVLGQSQTRQEVKEGKENTADLQERKAFEKATQGAMDLDDSLDQLRDTIRDNDGIDLDNYKGQDISGVGRLEQHVPDILASSKQMSVRRAALSSLASRIYAQSGKAITNNEKAMLTKIMGMGEGMDEKQFAESYKALREVAAHVKQRAEANYQGAAEGYKANITKKPTPAPAPSGPPKAEAGTVEMTDQAGDTYDIPADKVKDAEASGLKRK